jgi:hypothetical protein
MHHMGAVAQAQPVHGLLYAAAIAVQMLQAPGLAVARFFSSAAD